MRRSWMGMGAAAILLLRSGVSNGADDTKATAGRPMALTLVADLTVSSPVPDEKPIPLNTWTRVDYKLDRRSSTLDVSLHAIALTVKQGGTMNQKLAIDRSFWKQMPQAGADTVEMAFEKAPPGLQALLRDFDTPAITITYDSTGRETDRKVRLDKETGKVFINIAEMIASLHAPIPAADMNWQAPISLAVGEGQVANGSLKFKRGETDGNQPVPITVSGELPLTGKMGPGTLKNGVYVVSGELSYDPIAKEWRSGKWNMAMNAEMVNPANEKPMANLKGNVTLTLGPPQSIKTPSDALTSGPTAMKSTKP